MPAHAANPILPVRLYVRCIREQDWLLTHRLPVSFLQTSLCVPLPATYMYMFAAFVFGPDCLTQQDRLPARCVCVAGTEEQKRQQERE